MFALKKRLALATALALLVCVLMAGLQGALKAEGALLAGSETGIAKAVEYLRRVQNSDGGFPARPGGESSRQITCWAIMALQAAGEDVAGPAWTKGGKNPLQYLEGCGGDLEQTTDYALVLLALSSAGKGPVYKNTDLAKRIASWQQSDGALLQPGRGENGMLNAHMWSVLALVGAGREIPDRDKARQWLLARQNEDGGFSWLEGYASDADDTAVALQTLVALGEDPENSDAIKKALGYLRECQEGDGGFRSGDVWMTSGGNAATDAWVIQGLIAVGQDPQSVRWLKNGKNAVSHLLSLQCPDGSFNWKEGVSSSPVLMTAYALTAMTGKPFPINLHQAKQSQTSAKSVFLDVGQEHWAYEPIIELAQAGVLGGYADGTFRPEHSVTRAEFAAFLCRGLGLEKDSGRIAPRFPDVSANHWAAQAIAAVADKGYMKGKAGGIFDPNGQITGAELASIMVRALPAEKRNSAATGPYWYSASVETARANGLLYLGFEPRKSATRAQCAFSIVQMRKLLGLD